MLRDAIRYKMEITQLIKDFPDKLVPYSLSSVDWMFLKHLYNVLKPFDRFTKHVSSRRPTITTSTSIYFSLSKLLNQARNHEGPYATYPLAITEAVYRSLERFNKYYKFMDNNITYYIASILDPRIKGAWIKKQHDNGNNKLEEVRTTIRKLYPAKGQVQDPVASSLSVDNDNPLSILQEMIGELRQDSDAKSIAFVSDVD